MVSTFISPSHVFIIAALKCREEFGLMGRQLFLTVVVQANKVGASERLLGCSLWDLLFSLNFQVQAQMGAIICFNSVTRLSLRS